MLFPDAIANLSTIQKQLSIVSLGGYGDPPDFKARYASGLSALGAAVFEADAEFAFNPISLDTPYELDLSSPSRRGEPADLARVVNSYSSAAPINDDAPFSVAELERLLRSYDSDAAKLPDRLWNLVDAFDPDKLAVQNAMARGDINLDNFSNFTPNSLQRVIAQTDAAIRRRQVTTDSWTHRRPTRTGGARILFGADGLPGVPNFDDDNDGIIDEGDEVIASLRTDCSTSMARNRSKPTHSSAPRAVTTTLSTCSPTHRPRPG